MPFLVLCTPCWTRIQHDQLKILPPEISIMNHFVYSPPGLSLISSRPAWIVLPPYCLHYQLILESVVICPFSEFWSSLKCMPELLYAIMILCIVHIWVFFIPNGSLDFWEWGSYNLLWSILYLLHRYLLTDYWFHHMNFNIRLYWFLNIQGEEDIDKTLMFKKFVI